MSNKPYFEETIANIIGLVDASKDKPRKLQTNIACSLTMTGCGLYVLHMKKRHNIDVSI